MINKIIKSQICLMFVSLMFMNNCCANYSLKINKEVDKSLILFDAVKDGEGLNFSSANPEVLNEENNWELTTHIFSYNNNKYTIEILHFYPRLDYLIFKSYIESNYYVAQYYNHYFKKANKYHPLQIILSLTPKAVENPSDRVIGKEEIVKNFNSRYASVDNLLFVNSSLMTPLSRSNVFLRETHYYLEFKNKKKFMESYLISTFKKKTETSLSTLCDNLKNIAAPFSELKNEYYDKEYPEFKNNLNINLHKLHPTSEIKNDTIRKNYDNSIHKYLSETENKLFTLLEKTLNEHFDELENLYKSFDKMLLNEILSLDLVGIFTNMDEDYVNPIFSSFFYEITAIVIQQNNLQTINAEILIKNLTTFLKKEFIKKELIENYYNNYFEEIYNKIEKFASERIEHLKTMFEDDKHLKEFSKNLNLFISNGRKFYKERFSSNLDNVLEDFLKAFFEVYTINFNYFTKSYKSVYQKGESSRSNSEVLLSSLPKNTENKQAENTLDAKVYLDIGGWTNGPRSMTPLRTFIPFQFFSMYKDSKAIKNIFDSNEIYCDLISKKTEYLSPTKEDISKVGFKSDNDEDIRAILQKFASFQEYDKEISHADSYIKNAKIEHEKALKNKTLFI